MEFNNSSATNLSLSAQLLSTSSGTPILTAANPFNFTLNNKIGNGNGRNEFEAKGRRQTTKNLPVTSTPLLEETMQNLIDITPVGSPKNASTIAALISQETPMGRGVVRLDEPTPTKSTLTFDHILCDFVEIKEGSFKFIGHRRKVRNEKSPSNMLNMNGIFRS